MPTIRQSLISSLTRLYPLYSGGSTFANKSFIQKLAGNSSECVWTHVQGGEVLAPLNDYVGRSVFYAGDLDRKITWICSQLVRRGDTVLDIGANIGIVTVSLSELVGKKGKVHSFEPNPKMQAIIEKALEHNQISNVCLHKFALGAEQGVLELNIPKFNAGSASLIYHSNSSDCDKVSVQVRSLSSVVTEENIDTIRLIKIDVEGFEYNVLKGGEEVLNKIRPDAILFELNDRSDKSVHLIRDEPAIKILNKFGYKFFAIPKCLFKMRLKPFNFEDNIMIGHDILAIAEGDSYYDVCKLVNASPY